MRDRGLKWTLGFLKLIMAITRLKAVQLLSHRRANAERVSDTDAVLKCICTHTQMLFLCHIAIETFSKLKLLCGRTSIPRDTSNFPLYCFSLFQANNKETLNIIIKESWILKRFCILKYCKCIYKKYTRNQLLWENRRLSKGQMGP